MRLRRHKVRREIPVEQPVVEQSGGKQEEVKIAEPVNSNRPAGLLRQIISNPDFPVQMMMVLLTLSSDHVKMDRRIDSMTSTVDNIRNVTNLINNTMQSLKTAAEAPKQIRRMLQ